jgi:uncharacterized membrane protein
MMGGFGGGMGWVGWLVTALVWVLVVAGMVWLARGLAGGPPQDRTAARRRLDEHFAAGELSVEEYQARRRALG